MQVRQPTSGILSDFQPYFPGKWRWHPSQEMIFQALIAHEFIDQKALNPPLIVLSAITDKLDKIWVLDYTKKIYFINPLLMPLNIGYTFSQIVQFFFLDSLRVS